MTKLSALPRGPVPLTPRSAALLGQLATQLGRPLALSMAPEPIEDAEAALASVIPFDVIAVLAVEQRAAGALVQLTRGVRAYYRAHGQEVAREVGLDHVAFAQLVGTPDDWTEEPRLAAYATGIDRRQAAWVKWDLRRPTSGGEPCSLDAYLRERWNLEPRADAPALTLTLQATVAPAVEEHARHAKFGRGRVLSRQHDKVTLAFEDGTVRTFAERFVTRD